VLAPLEGIDTLETLRFANNGIRDLNVMTTLPSLNVVDLSGHEIVDLSALELLPNLESVFVYGNPVDLSSGSSQLELLNAIIAKTEGTLLNKFYSLWV